MQDNFVYESVLNRVKSRIYIPEYRSKNIHLNAIGEIAFLAVENLPACLFMSFSNKKLFIASIPMPGYERCGITKTKKNGRVVANMKLPKSMAYMKDSLIGMTAEGFRKVKISNAATGDVLVCDVEVIDRDNAPKTLLDRFIFNTADLCSVNSHEEEGDVRVEDNSPVESRLYIKGELACIRKFNFEKNSCTFHYTTSSDEVIKMVSQSYAFLNYDNRHVTEEFTSPNREI